MFGFSFAFQWVIVRLTVSDAGYSSEGYDMAL